jgi:hypothetical protein
VETHPVDFTGVPWGNPNGAVTEVTESLARMVKIPGIEEQGLAPSGPVVELLHERVQPQALPRLGVEILQGGAASGSTRAGIRNSAGGVRPQALPGLGVEIL